MKKINFKYIFISLLFFPTSVFASSYMVCGGKNFPSLFVNIISIAFLIVKIFVPILLVITGMISYFKVVISSNVSDEMKKANSKLVTNIIAAVIIFFVMSIVNFVLNLIPNTGSVSECLRCFINPDKCEKVEVTNRVCTGLLTDQDKYDEDCNLIEPLEVVPISRTSSRGTGSGTSAGSRASGDWSNWAQCDSRWGSVTLDPSNQTICRVGCLTTSLAILMAKSGTHLTVNNFSPATIARTVKYDYNGNMYWSGWESVAPNWKLVSDTGSGVNGLGVGKKAKAQKIKSLLDQGCMLTVTVKPGEGHWVAVDYVIGDEVFIVDPANVNNRNLFSSYNVNNVTRAVCFKG